MEYFEKLSRQFRDRQKVFDLASLESVINLLPHPAVVINKSTWRFVLVSASLTRLTAYTLSEVVGSYVESLFPTLRISGYLFKQRVVGEKLLVDMAMRSGGVVKVEITPISLDSKNHWLLLLIEPVALRKQKLYDQNQSARRSEAHLLLFRAIQHPDLEAALDTALKAANELTGAGILAVYQPLAQEPGYMQSALRGPTKILPEKLPANTILPFDQDDIFLWTQTMHAGNLLQSAARAAELKYLLTVPLRLDLAIVGVLVIADWEIEPTEPLIQSAQLVGQALATIIQNNILTNNLVNQLNNQKSIISLGEIIFDSVTTGIIIVDQNLLITNINEAAETMLGYTRDEVYREHIENVIIGSDQIGTSLQSGLNNIPTYNLSGFELHRRDGQGFLTALDVIPIKTQSNDQKLIALFFKDLSEREAYRAHTQALENRAILGQFTAMLAHEIKNPINNISTGLQLISMGIPENDSKTKPLNRIREDLSRLNQIVDSTLTYSRTPKITIKPLDLKELVVKIIERWRPRLGRVNITPHYTFSKPSPRINGDKLAIERVFTNLFNNAYHAMKETGGSLGVKVQQLSTNHHRNMVEITVSDNGPGIPEEVLDKIFEPFVTTKGEGTGLGLAITKQIITAHKGSITVNTIPGGTVFRIILPASEENEVTTFIE